MATLNATLIFSVDNIPADKSSDEDDAAEAKVLSINGCVEVNTSPSGANA